MCWARDMRLTANPSSPLHHVTQPTQLQGNLAGSRTNNSTVPASFPPPSTDLLCFTCSLWHLVISLLVLFSVRWLPWRRGSGGENGTCAPLLFCLLSRTPRIGLHRQEYFYLQLPSSQPCVVAVLIYIIRLCNFLVFSGFERKVIYFSRRLAGFFKGVLILSLRHFCDLVVRYHVSSVIWLDIDDIKILQV